MSCCREEHSKAVDSLQNELEGKMQKQRHEHSAEMARLEKQYQSKLQAEKEKADKEMEAEIEVLREKGSELKVKA